MLDQVDDISNASVYIGISLGAYGVAKLALKHIEKVQRLILVVPFFDSNCILRSYKVPMDSFKCISTWQTWKTVDEIIENNSNIIIDIITLTHDNEIGRFCHKKWKKWHTDKPFRVRLHELRYSNHNNIEEILEVLKSDGRSI